MEAEIKRPVISPPDFRLASDRGLAAGNGKRTIDRAGSM
jgi:hypothetical protein